MISGAMVLHRCDSSAFLFLILFMFATIILKLSVGLLQVRTVDDEFTCEVRLLRAEPTDDAAVQDCAVWVLGGLAGLLRVNGELSLK